MDIMKGYCLGPTLHSIPQRFWDEQAVFTKSGRFYGKTFLTERGVTQGDLFYPTFFNIVVDTGVRAMLMEV